MKEEQWEAASGPPCGVGGPTNAAMGGVGIWGLRGQCLTFFSSGGKGKRTLHEAGSPWPCPVCLSVVGLFPGKCGRITSHSPPLPGPPAIFGGPVWFLVWLESHEDVGLFNKRANRELVPGGGLVLVFNGGVDYLSKMHSC